MANSLLMQLVLFKSCCFASNTILTFSQPPPLRPFSPPIEPRSASVELPFAPPNIDIPISPKSTPEFSKKKRANWGAPAKLSFMEDTTSLILQDVGEVFLHKFSPLIVVRG